MSSPEASGSSVPACPAFFALKAFFASWSARFELIPTGLSSSGIDQARKPVASLHRLVVFEAQLRSGVELDAPGELRAQEPGGALEALRRFFDMGRVQRGEEHFGMGKVGRHVDARKGDHAHARVAQLALQELGELPLDEVSELLGTARGALTLHRKNVVCP
jgi:hypothetical protein